MCVMWFSESVLVLASTEGACEHLNTTRVSEDTDIRGGAHSVKRSESEGVVTCYYTQWVQVISTVCVDCGHTQVFGILYHQQHDKCNTYY